MANSERFQLGVKVLALLAEKPEGMMTSAEIADTLKESAVMVRRSFLLLHKAGLIMQRKGPHGGAKLKLTPKMCAALIGCDGATGRAYSVQHLILDE